MKASLALTLLMNAIVPAAALAQGVPAQRTIVSSFEALPAVVKVGQEVRVKDLTGDTTSGKLVSVSEQQLVVARRQYPFPYFRPRKEVALAGQNVRRVDAVDSAWNGALIGAAAMVGFLAVTIAADCSPACDDNFGVPGRWALGSLMLIPLGAAFGGLIDSLINRTVYQGQAGPSQITIAPLLQRDARGAVVQLRF
jgi:hypothetical protein